MCPAAQQLLSQYYNATSIYADRARRLRPVAVALLFAAEPEAAIFDAARAQAEATRRACEQARAALHFHVSAHGC